MKRLDRLKKSCENDFEEIVVEMFEELKDMRMSGDVKQTVRRYLYKLHNEKVKE